MKKEFRILTQYFDDWWYYIKKEADAKSRYQKYLGDIARELQETWRQDAEPKRSEIIKKYTRNQ